MTDLPGIVITGASGRMGQMLIQTVLASGKVRLVGCVERRLDIHQHASLQRTAEHLAGVQTGLGGNGSYELRADCVGRLCQISDAGARCRSNPIGEREQLAGLWMLRGRVAQQDSFAFTGEQRRRNFLGGVRSLNRHRRSNSIGRRNGRSNLGK